MLAFDWFDSLPPGEQVYYTCVFLFLVLLVSVATAGE